MRILPAVEDSALLGAQTINKRSEAVGSSELFRSTSRHLEPDEIHVQLDCGNLLLQFSEVNTFVDIHSFVAATVWQGRGDVLITGSSYR